MTEEKIIQDAAFAMFNEFRNAYQAKNWTQRDVAHYLDVSPVLLNKAIKGYDNSPKGVEIRNQARKLLEMK